MKSLYCTVDKIAMGTGGGAVTVNELEALRSVSDVDLVLSQDNIAPAVHDQPDSPFLYDYFALQQVQGYHFDIAHFYSGCFTETIRYLKEHGARVSYTVAAHDRKVSIEEFRRLGMEYPFHHISDDRLWQNYTEGIRLADLVIAPSGKSAEVLNSDIGCENIRVIPHGITQPEGIKPIPDNFDVAYLGAVGPDKGLIYLIQAWGILDYPDSRLILAGTGTETLDPFIHQVTDKGTFVLLGRVTDVAEVYNACSVYIQPSVTEAFGIEIPEAMSYARPVIASEGAGASELITNNSEGYRVPIRNPQAIADLIDVFYQDRDKISYMGERAWKKSIKYTWDRIKEQYATIYSSLQAK